VSAEAAAVMLASIRAGAPVELPEEETLASALAGGIGLDNRHSFQLIRDRIAEHVTVSEAQIGEAMRYCVSSLRLVVEGGGAVAIAALLSDAWGPPPDEDGPVVVVLSGGNVAASALASVLS
jgi:threonine dehydratase